MILPDLGEYEECLGFCASLRPLRVSGRQADRGGTDTEEPTPEDQGRAILLQEIPGVEAPSVRIPHSGFEDGQGQQPAGGQS